MATVAMDELALANIALAEFVVDTTTYRTTRIDEIAYSAVIDEGQETLLRVKNEFVATNRFEDLQYGSDLTLKQVTFTPEILELIDGGTMTKDSDGTTIIGYAPPAAATIVNRKKFKVNIYVEVKNKEGKYACFTFDKLKGKPASFSFKDGEFIAPEYNASSRLNAGEVPYKVTFVDTLPAD